MENPVWRGTAAACLPVAAMMTESVATPATSTGASLEALSLARPRIINSYLKLFAQL